MATSMSSPAVNLHPRLVRFFARYPPGTYSAKFGKIFTSTTPSNTKTTSTETTIVAPNTSSSNPNASMAETTTIPLPLPLSETPEPNPFTPHKNPSTGHWRAPAISLRRQADLVKLAQKYGVEPLLPPSKKSSESRRQRALEKLRVKGTGVGEKVKGHKWERMKSVKLEERRKAMEGMPEMIRMWKQRGHGKWWKKYPR